MTIFACNFDANNVQHNLVANACQIPMWFFDSHVKLNDANVILYYLCVTLNIFAKIAKYFMHLTHVAKFMNQENLMALYIYT